MPMKVGAHRLSRVQPISYLEEQISLMLAALHSFNVVREAIYNLNLNIKMWYICLITHVHATIGYCIIIMEEV